MASGPSHVSRPAPSQPDVAHPEAVARLHDQRLAELLASGATVKRIIRCELDATLYLNEIGRPMTGWRYLVAGRIIVISQSGFQAWPASWAWPAGPWEPPSATPPTVQAR